MVTNIRYPHENTVKSLNSGEAQMFSQDALKDTTVEMREDCYDVSKMAIGIGKRERSID